MRVQTINADDGRIIWSGAVSLQKGDGWVRPWRIPFADIDLFPPEALQQRAGTCAGVRLRFATDAEELSLVMEPAPGEGNLDLEIAGEIVCTKDFAEGDSRVTFDGLAKGRKIVELWLHHTTPFKVRALELPHGAVFERVEDERPKWITYGSSISHCGAAASPAFTWPGVVARARGFNLTCLGFGGNCHAESMIARLIRDLPADYISLKLGINIHGSGSLNERSFLPAVIGSIAIIREKHATTPLAICSPIICPPRESTPNIAGLSLQMMREILQDAVERFQARGDCNIHYIDGLKLFGEAHVDYLPDDLHPNADGYKLLGENFLAEIAGIW